MCINKDHILHRDFEHEEFTQTSERVESERVELLRCKSF